MGRTQAEHTGKRLAALYAKYLKKLDDDGKEVTDKTNFQLVKSTMTRATETANIILTHLPDDNIILGQFLLVKYSDPSIRL